jgi:hypothetical protein
MISKTRNGKPVTKMSLFGAAHGVSAVYQPNEEIYGEGEPGKRVYQVLRGVVRTCQLLSDGRRQIVTFYFAGDMFGLGLAANYGTSAKDNLELARVANSVGDQAVSLSAVLSEIAALAAALNEYQAFDARRPNPNFSQSERDSISISLAFSRTWFLDMAQCAIRQMREP